MPKKARMMICPASTNGGCGYFNCAHFYPHKHRASCDTPCKHQLRGTGWSKDGRKTAKCDSVEEATLSAPADTSTRKSRRVLLVPETPDGVSGDEGSTGVTSEEVK